MTTRETTPSDATGELADDRLEVHVFNAGIGESIVLGLPGGKWGVVDCYATSLADETTNPALAFLQAKGVGELEFLCLSHAHDDHYRGMSQLLRKLSIREFWRFGAVETADLQVKLAQVLLDEADRTGDPAVLESVRELPRILGEVERRRRRSRNRFAVRYVGENQDLYPLPPPPPGAAAVATIRAVAPSGNQISRYHRALDDYAIRVTSHPARRAKRVNQNIASVALVITYGQARVVLGGDVETEGWDDALRVCAPNGLAADVVKVSHHGSDTGYAPGLWAAFSACGKPIAIVTPYRRFQLPKAAALRHIRSHATELLTTHPVASLARHPPAAPGSPLGHNMASRLAVQQMFGLHEVPTGFGCCTVYCYPSGSCLVQRLVPPAGRI